jgi:hypothetical protein
VYKTPDEIIQLLDQSCFSLKVVFMTILIEMYDKIPAIQEIAMKIFRNPSEHSWIITPENLRFLFALMPDDVILNVFSHISSQAFSCTYLSYLTFIDQKSKASFSSAEFYSFNIISGLLSSRIWSSRRSIFNHTGENFLSVLEIIKNDENIKGNPLDNFTSRLIFLEKGFQTKDPLLVKSKQQLKSFHIQIDISVQLIFCFNLI